MYYYNFIYNYNSNLEHYLAENNIFSLKLPEIIEFLFIVDFRAITSIEVLQQMLTFLHIVLELVNFRPFYHLIFFQ